MSINEKLKELIREREKIEGDIDYDNSPVIKDIVKLLSEDIAATIEFLDNECTESQFIWLSEVFDEIAEQTKSKEIIDALRRTSQKYPEVTRDYNIEFFIDSAEEFLQ